MLNVNYGLLKIDTEQKIVISEIKISIPKKILVLKSDVFFDEEINKPESSFQKGSWTRFK